MKKILLFFILSVISIHGFAASCANGNEPIKAVSADGSYFEYKCQEQIRLNTGRLSGFRSLSTSSYGYMIVNDIVRAGKEAQRFEVRPGDCGEDQAWSDCNNNRERSEISLDNHFFPGDNQWIAFSVFIPDNFKTSNSVSTTIGQIHQIGGPSGIAGSLPSFPPLIQLEAKGNNYRACIHILSGSDNNVVDECKYYNLSAISDMQGQWTDIQIHFDTSNNKSLIEVYLNNERKALLREFVNFWPKSYYIKYGIYRSFVSQHTGPMPTQVVWIDEVKMGKNQELVAINKATPVD